MNRESLELAKNYADALQDYQILQTRIDVLKMLIDREEKSNLNLDMQYGDKEKVVIRGSINTDILKELFGFTTPYDVMETARAYNEEKKS
jgi:uncharacterized protein (UPF0216 family)